MVGCTQARWLALAWVLAACGPIHDRPEDAGPDFAAQGEYAGPELGAQVIALGDDRFEAVFLPGGLPGEGWDGATRISVQGERSGSEVVFDGPIRAALRGGELRGTAEDGHGFVLRKVARASPTLGAPAPRGAVAPFEAELTEGILEAGATSRERFHSFELHLEFRTPFMPTYRGQRRGNSGVYLQNRYEIQVLDSFGLPERDDECGALYAQKAPRINMTFPPLSWQTYDVVFWAAEFDAEGRRTRPAVVTLRHNGVLVHDRVELTGPMDGGDPEGAQPGPLHLQDLWIPVVYRNVWLRPIERADPLG